MEKKFEGEWIERRVIIWGDEGLSLYNSSGFGKPKPEDKPNRLELDLIEAAFLLEEGKITVSYTHLTLPTN